MSLKGQGLVATTTGGSKLTLQAQANESYRVRKINVYHTVTAGLNIDVTVDRTRVLQFNEPSAWNIVGTVLASQTTSLTDKLHAMGMHPVIPVARGQTLEVSDPGGSRFIEVIYDRYDEGDVRADEPNGSESSTYRLFQQISNSAAVTAGGDVSLDQSDLDDIFPAFPGGEEVPARTTMQLLALFGGPIGRGDGGGNHTQHTTRLKFLKDRRELFDQSLDGMLFVGDQSVSGSTPVYGADASRIDVSRDGYGHRIEVFDPPIEFPSGEEMNVRATVQENNTGGDLAAGDIKVGLLFDVFRS